MADAWGKTMFTIFVPPFIRWSKFPVLCRQPDDLHLRVFYDAILLLPSTALLWNNKVHNLFRQWYPIIPSTPPPVLLSAGKILFQLLQQIGPKTLSLALSAQSDHHGKRHLASSGRDHF